MWTHLSREAASAIRGSHTMDVRAIAVNHDGGFVEVPVVSGQVTCDATSQRRRTAQIGVGVDSLWPDSATDALSPIGSELAVSYGIVLRNHTEWIPVIRGPIQRVQRTLSASPGDAALMVDVSDRSQTVAEARLDAPVQTSAGALTVSEIERLITDVVDTVVIDRTESTKVAPQIEIERERWSDGIEKLADSIGAEVFNDPSGKYFVIRPEPTVDDDPVWTLDTDEMSVLISQDDEFSRELVYNRVVASGQRTDGTPPVYAVASDTNPLSPTYIDGPFGIKTRFYASPLLTTVAQCQSAATSLLARVTGHHLNITFSNVTNPTLEAGDVIRLRSNGRDDIHIIDAVTIPLSPTEPQQIRTRSLTLPEESVAG